MGLALDESKDSKETSFYRDKIKFLVDERLKDMIDVEIPVSIDFRKSFFGEGFVARYGSTGCHE